MEKQFWDTLFESYPKAVKEFYVFIDEYKENNSWNDLFGDKIKFHHLPAELQIGVWIAFQFEQGCGNFEITFGSDVFESESMWEWCSEWFRDREININLEIK